MKNPFDYLHNIQNTHKRLFYSKTASIISGIVCAIPFVFDKAFLLSFVMYIPMYYLFDSNEKLKYTLPRVFLFCFGYYFVGYSFLMELYPLDYAGFSPMEAVGVIAFALTVIPAIHSVLFCLCFAFCKGTVRGRGYAFKLLAFPAVFVINEFAQTLGPLAFPWCRVCIAQGAFLPFLQSADVFGSYFICYIVILINGFIAVAIIDNKYSKRMIALASAVFALNTAYGVIMLAVDGGNDKNGDVTAIALQGNYSSSEKWSASTDNMRDAYFDLTLEAVSRARELDEDKDIIVLLSETALPVLFVENKGYYKDFSEFAIDNHINIAVGAFSDVNDMEANSVFMFDDEDKIYSPYSKRVLVPFGEYMPYREVFTAIMPSLAEINMLSSDLYKGNDTAIFRTDIGDMGAVICYESIFPWICRKTVMEGAEVILLSTNDSWFGSSVALKHHLVASRVRAIENGTPVVRSANTGISAVINRRGRYLSRLEPDVKGYAMAQIEYKKERTIYNYIGDVWVFLCFLYMVYGYIVKFCRNVTK